jgi:AcrR family transcriptional regulator
VKKQTVEQRRAEILEATSRVVIERGFAATRVSDVAKALAVSPSLIHYHFDSKEQLLAEAFDHFARTNMAELRAGLAEEPDAVAKLDRLLRESVPEGSDDVEWQLWIDAWGEALRNPQMRAISQALDVDEQGTFERVIAEGVAEGSFVAVDPHAAAMRLTALIDGLAVQFAAHDGVIDRGEVLDHLRRAASVEVGVVIGGVAAPVSAPRPGATPATEAALRRLVDQYCDATLQGDHDQFARLWVHEARWSKGDVQYVGRDDIVSGWDKTLGSLQWIVLTAPLASFDVDEGTGTATGRVVLNERSMTTAGTTGTELAVAHDRYGREADGWRFVERSITVVDAS